MGKVRIVGVLLVATMMLIGTAGAEVALVVNGQPRAVIVTAEQPLQNAQEAAEELQRYLERITGARLDIVSERVMADGAPPDGFSLVLVGRSTLTDRIEGLKIPSGLTKSFQEEGFVIFCRDNLLVLAGNDEGFYLGTRYAVCELLERIGVRWFTPGEFGEVVPKMETVRVGDTNEMHRPDFPIRDYWTHSRGNMEAERDEWKIHNKMTPRNRGWTQWLGMPGDGSVVELMPRDQFQEHPEWFALQRDGSRMIEMPCMTNDGIIRHFIERVKARAAAGSKATAFAPIDGMPRCFCDNCLKMATGFDGFGTNTRDPLPGASITNEWFYFVNRIAEEVHKEYPDHVVATNGYANRDMPPELPDFNRHNNLVTMFANIVACTIHDYDTPHCWQMQRQGEMIKRWCELCDKVWIYNYNYTMLVAKDTLTPMVSRIRRTIPRLKEWGLFGFFDQDEADWSMTGITTHYVRAKLEWDTQADVDAILEDYYEKWFGPAAVAMKSYYEGLENAFATSRVHGHEDVILPEIYNDVLMNTIREAMREAVLAADAEPFHQRVHLEQLVFNVLEHYVVMEKAKQDCRYDEAMKRCEQMLAIKKEMNDITPFFGWRPYPVYGPEWERKRMARLKGMLEGPDGQLITVAPRLAKFRPDRFDDGIYQRWYDPVYDDVDWITIDMTRGWENQGLEGMLDDRGHPYTGYGWYRFTVEVPAEATRQQPFRPYLFCPAIVNEAWIWVNGRYVGRKAYQEPWFRPSEFDLDLTDALNPGPNQVTIRVLSNFDVFGASGLYERMFLYNKLMQQ